MKIAAQSINTHGTVIEWDKLQRGTEYYDRQYQRACYLLFDKGYIDSPSIFDLSSFLLAFGQEFPNDYQYFVSFLSGEIRVDALAIEYILTKASYDSTEALVLLHDIAEAEEALNFYSNFVSNRALHKKWETLSVKSKINIYSRVQDSSQYKVVSPYIQDILSIPEGNLKIDLFFGDEYLHSIARDCGIADDIFEKYRSENKPLFLRGKGMTFEREAKFALLFMSGFITPDGDYADEYKKRVVEYYESYYSSRESNVDIMGYQEKIFLDSLNNIIDRIKQMRLELGDSFIRDLYIGDLSVSFLVKGESSDNGLPRDNFTVGAYVFDWYNNKDLGSIPKMLGFSGEFLPVKSINALGFSVKGLPVCLGDSFYYPLYRVYRDKELTIQLHPKIGYECCIEYENTYTQLIKQLSGYVLTSINKKTINTYCLEHNEDYSYVCLLLALQFAICGKVIDTCTYSREASDSLISNGIDVNNSVDLYKFLEVVKTELKKYQV